MDDRDRCTNNENEEISTNNKTIHERTDEGRAYLLE